MQSVVGGVGDPPPTGEESIVGWRIGMNNWLGQCDTGEEEKTSAWFATLGASPCYIPFLTPSWKAYRTRFFC
jgi:hypothetical protein